MPQQLVQFGNSYQPAAFLASAPDARVFTGSLDPSTVPGVVLTVNDTWETGVAQQAVGFGVGSFGATQFGG